MCVCMFVASGGVSCKTADTACSHRPEQEHVVGLREVDPHRPRAHGQQEHGRRRVVGERLHTHLAQKTERQWMGTQMRDNGSFAFRQNLVCKVRSRAVIGSDIPEKEVAVYQLATDVQNRGGIEVLLTPMDCPRTCFRSPFP